MLATTVRVAVTARDISAGLPEDCHRCAVALAVAREWGGNPEVAIAEIDWKLRIGVDNRYAPAPAEVVEFVERFDRAKTSADPATPLPAPFAFDLPGPDDPAWLSECRECEHLFAPADLDGDGSCSPCRGRAGHQ